MHSLCLSCFLPHGHPLAWPHPPRQVQCLLSHPLYPNTLHPHHIFPLQQDKAVFLWVTVTMPSSVSEILNSCPHSNSNPHSLASALCLSASIPLRQPSTLVKVLSPQILSHHLLKCCLTNPLNTAGGSQPSSSIGVSSVGRPGWPPLPFSVRGQELPLPEANALVHNSPPPSPQEVPLLTTLLTSNPQD